MRHIRAEILNWYLVHKRSLPWRETKNPYDIWLSEIILQQTRVEQGMSYYYKFLERFPTVFDLAEAKEQEVLNLWQGLGYYSRARNLHRTAKEIVDVHQGEFPQTYDGLLSLKGIGPYTAAAIASFSFDLPHAVLDGNVFRVLSRIHNWDVPINSTQGKKDFEKLANELLDIENPGLFNQAMMEFGALHCKPTQALCHVCPVAIHCLGFQEKKVDQLPVKLKKQAIRKRFFLFEIIRVGSSEIFIERREQKDIWQHLYQFPLKEFETPEAKEAYLNSTEHRFISKEYKHILSHQHLICHFIVREQVQTDDGLAIQINEIVDYPIPRAIDRFLDEYGLDIFHS